MLDFVESLDQAADTYYS